MTSDAREDRTIDIGTRRQNEVTNAHNSRASIARIKIATVQADVTVVLPRSINVE